MEVLRFILGITFICMGLLVFCIQLIGVWKFKYILNRMHAAGMGDTMGISLCLIGAMFLFGWSYTSFKIAMIIAFLWLASPVSSHLIARLEVTTNENLEDYCAFESPSIDFEEVHLVSTHQNGQKEDSASKVYIREEGDVHPDEWVHQKVKAASLSKRRKKEKRS